MPATKAVSTYAVVTPTGADYVLGVQAGAVKLFGASALPIAASSILLAGLSLATATAITSADTILSAAGKLQAQITANAAALGTSSSLASDTDGTLAANSDARVATQKAVKTYVDNAVTGLLDFKGSTNCSANPNYPVALKGDSYVVSAAGKIGGASGTSVDIGDVYFATADNAGGTQASVGTSWAVLEHNLVGAALTANNLSDLASASTARANLGLGSIATQAASAVAITGGTLAGLTGLAVRNVGTGAFDATIAYNGTLTAGRTLTLNLNDAARAVSLAGDLTTAAAFSTSGAFALTLTTTAGTNVTLPTTGTLSAIAGTETLTNKRVTARVGSTASSATPTINTDNVDVYKLTAQTVDITSFTTNLSGSPVDGDVLFIEITGTAARAITWGTSFEASTIALPTTTVTTAMLAVGFKWNAATSKWRCMGVA